MQPALALRVDGIHHLNSLWASCWEGGEGWGLPWMLPHIQPCQGMEWPPRVDDVRGDPWNTSSHCGSPPLFPQAAGAQQKPLYCFLPRNGARSFYRLLLTEG